jgi:hypothetical protein
MSYTQRKSNLSLLIVLALLLLFTQAQRAMANTSASVYLSDYFTGINASDSQTNSAASATATLFGVTGNAKSMLATGSVGVGMELSPSSAFGFYNAAASWDDAWTLSGNYFGPLAPVAATFTLNGSIATSLFTSSTGFWELTFRYRADNNDLLSFSASADGGPARLSAYSSGNDITSSLIFTTNAIDPSLTDFSLSYTAPPFLVAFYTNGGSFNDNIDALLMVDSGGPLKVDAFHSLSVTLASLDPNVILTDVGGRSAVPEPESYVLLGIGLGLIGWTRHRSKHSQSPLLVSNSSHIGVR